MRQYEKRIETYKNLIQKEYVREQAVQKAMDQCADIVDRQADTRTPYFVFLFEQFKFIKKRWWALQSAILMLIWFLLADSAGGKSAERALGALAVIFAVMIIPEIWKNRRFSAVEIEKTAFYSLRQICSTRLLLFAAADLAMLTVFFAVSIYTLPISAYRLIIDFLVPFNVSGCICFRLLYSRWNDTEYLAVFLSMLCVFLWSLIVSTDSIYQRISTPVWIGLTIVSFAYLVFCIYRSQSCCEINWEVRTNGAAI